MGSANSILLSVKNLRKYFPIKSGILSRVTGNVHAVDDISFDLKPGETMGLVGESGCGKSTTARVILRLIESTSGEVFFDDKNVFELNRNKIQQLRREMQIIFQDPYSSLNPRMTVEGIVGEALSFHRIARGSTRSLLIDPRAIL